MQRNPKNFLEEYLRVKDELDPLRDEINRLEDEINRLMNGELYGKFKRGIETYGIREFERLWKKYPQARSLVVQCLRKMRELYERLYGVSIEDPSLRADVCVQNVRKLLDKFDPPFSLMEYARASK